MELKINDTLLSHRSSGQESQPGNLKPYPDSQRSIGDSGKRQGQSQIDAESGISLGVVA